MKFFLVLIVLLGSAVDDGSTCDVCDLTDPTNAFYDCMQGLSQILVDALLADCNTHRGGADFNDWFDNLELMCTLKSTPASRCELSCDLTACNNPLHECFESFPALVQDALLGDCARHLNDGNFVDWIENVVMMCSLKSNINVDVVCPGQCIEYTVSGGVCSCNDYLINDVYAMTGNACPGLNGEIVPTFEGLNANWYWSYANFMLGSANVGDSGWQLTSVPRCYPYAGARLFTDLHEPEKGDQGKWKQWERFQWGALGANNLLVECTARA